MRTPIPGGGEKRIVEKICLYPCFKSCSLAVLNCGRANQNVLNPDGFQISAYQWHLDFKRSDC